jgi:hypothetical protein
VQVWQVARGVRSVATRQDARATFEGHRHSSVVHCLSRIQRSVTIAQRENVMSTVQSNRYWSRLTQSLFAAAFIFALVASAHGQTGDRKPSVPPPPEPTSIQSEKEKSDPLFGTPANEMRSKAILKDEKKKYEENLGRAREVSELASQLSESYESKKSFTSDDNKRLERLEKLTKRIRNEAGGSNSDADADLKDICTTMMDTLKHLAEMAEELHKMVDKTPRNVISAAVIDQANRVISITQHLRSSR